MKRSSHNLTAVEPIGDIEAAVTTLLRYVGEDPARDGLRDTPARVARAWREMTSGYEDDPAAILGRTFEESSDEMIILRRISNPERSEGSLVTPAGGCRRRRAGKATRRRCNQRCFASLSIGTRRGRDPPRASPVHGLPRGAAEETEMVTSCMLGTLRSDAASRSEFLCNSK